MAEEGKSQTYVKTHKAVAAGVASVIAAVSTYRLGVAGTLIGMELTAVVITLSSAIFKAQLMKASHHLASLPKMVRARPPYSRFTSPAKRTRNRTQSCPRQTRPWLALPLARHARFPQRVTVPQRPRVLLAGLLAGLLATVIGLALSPVLSSSEARSSPLRSGPAQRGFQLGRVI